MYACTPYGVCISFFFRWPWGLRSLHVEREPEARSRQAGRLGRQTARGMHKLLLLLKSPRRPEHAGNSAPMHVHMYVHTVDGELSSQHQPNQSTAGRLGRGRRCCPCAVCCLPFQLPQTLPVAYDPRIWNWTTHSHTRTVDTDASSFLILMVARYSRLARRPEYLTPHPRGHGAHLSSRPAGLASAASH